jgi:hypothetical protein
MRKAGEVMRTAKEIFEALRVLRPGITSVHRHGLSSSVVADNNGGRVGVTVQIDWNGYDCYPPPEPTLEQWRQQQLAILNTAKGHLELVIDAPRPKAIGYAGKAIELAYDAACHAIDLVSVIKEAKE